MNISLIPNFGNSACSDTVGFLVSWETQSSHCTTAASTSFYCQRPVILLTCLTNRQTDVHGLDMMVRISINQGYEFTQPGPPVRPHVYAARQVERKRKRVMGKFYVLRFSGIYLNILIELSDDCFSSAIQNSTVLSRTYCKMSFKQSRNTYFLAKAEEVLCGFY